MSDEQQFFTAHPLNRYAGGDFNRLESNTDGSPDLYCTARVSLDSKPG
jgi:hypothetical protein